MAKGNPILGLLRGSIGDITTYKTATGKQGVRVRRREIKNPKSDAQQIQRMVMATAAVSLGQLSEILSNSFEGRAFGVASQSYARKVAMNLLRAADVADTESRYNYLAKGAKAFAPNPYLLASGTLYAPAVTNVNESAQTFAFGAPALTAETLPSAMFPGVEVGNQITIVAVCGNEASPDFSPEDGAQNMVRYCRFAFATDELPALIAAEGALLKINPDAVDLVKVAGPWQSLRFTADGLCSVAPMFPSAFAYLQAAALIVSNLTNNKRSTSRMVVAEDAEFPMDGGLIYPTYGDSATALNLASEVYLNNSATLMATSVSTDGAANPSLPINLPAASSRTLKIASASEPTALTLVVEDGGETFTSSNIMNVNIGDAIGDSGAAANVRLTSRSYSSGILTISLENDSTAGFISVNEGTLDNASGSHEVA